MTYTRRELSQMETIEQAWDGDELKIQEDGLRVWLVLPENIDYSGDFIIETLINGKWVQHSLYEREPMTYEEAFFGTEN